MGNVGFTEAQRSLSLILKQSNLIKMTMSAIVYAEYGKFVKSYSKPESTKRFMDH
jgi:hypothetical protein